MSFINFDLASYTRPQAVYVLQLVTDGDTGTASLTSLTEYILKQPIFSFIVSGQAPVSSSEGGGVSSDSEEDIPRDPRLKTVGIKLHTISSK